MSKNQSNKQITPAQKEKASRRLLRLQPVLKGAAKSVAYLAAGVTAYCLLPGTPAGLLIPAALTPLIETIGPDLLAGIVEKVVEGKEKSNDDLFAILESAAAGLALNERQLANLPTRRDLYRAISYLAEQADKNQQQILANQDEILAALQQILSSRPSVPLFHGVPDMPTYFLGREELVTDLAARLTGGQTMALSAEGLPGVGKTALAAALAHDKRVLAYFSDGVLWAGLGKEGDALSALAGWAEALGGDVSQYAEVPARSQAVKNMIGQRRLLLVIDDAWESEAADALRCGGPGCVHLLTTRLKDVAQGFAGRDQAAFVPELEEDPAFALLQAYAPDACATNPEAAQALVQAVGGLPLALELLGGYLGATRRSATTRLSQKALAAMGDAQQRLTLACRRLGDLQGREVTLQETIFLSLQGLEAEPSGAEAVNAFYALGAMAPKPADFTWAAAGAAADCDEEAIAWLLERNLAELVDDDEGRLALHQALADVARAETDAAAVARHREYYLAAVNKNRGDWRRIERLYDQISWAWNHLPEDKNVLDYIWALRIYQERRGLWADYIDWVNRGLEIAQANDLKQDQGTLLNNLGGVYRGLGQPEKALQYFNEALPIIREVGDRMGEATTLNNLGEIYRKLGQPEKALRYLNKA
ncbi:MAG: tetratricopeptide repeat protein, partial [Chloroflexi bacterium]|nr:tetratricopeptide repeat protein [Chloroflexota bacterium]